MSKTILITGTYRGFRKIWANGFLKRDDKVIATARNIHDLNDLVKRYGTAVLPLQLDVTNREQCFAAVNKGFRHFVSIRECWYLALQTAIKRHRADLRFL